MARPVRDLWHGWAYDAWRFGAVAGDVACQIRTNQLPPRHSPLSQSSLPRTPGQLEAAISSGYRPAPHVDFDGPARGRDSGPAEGPGMAHHHAPPAGARRPGGPWTGAALAPDWSPPPANDGASWAGPADEYDPSTSTIMVVIDTGGSPRRESAVPEPIFVEVDDVNADYRWDATSATSYGGGGGEDFGAQAVYYGGNEDPEDDVF